MNDGSFNYLHSKELDDLLYSGFGGDWDAMLDKLDELCPEAAVEMRQIRLESQKFVEKHEARWSALQPLLHSIEWWRSGDYGKDQVDQAVVEYHAELAKEVNTNGAEVREL